MLSLRFSGEDKTSDAIFQLIEPSPSSSPTRLWEVLGSACGYKTDKKTPETSVSGVFYFRSSPVFVGEFSVIQSHETSDQARRKGLTKTLL